MSNTNGKNNSSKSKILAVALVVSLLAVQLPASRAHADENLGWDIDPGVAALVLLVVATEAGVMLNGAISGIGNLTYAVRGKKAPSAWRTYGYVFSALNLLVGSAILITHDYESDQGAVNLGASQAALGAAGLGITIWSNTLDDGTEQSVSIAPMVIPDKEGGVAVGAGLKLAGW